MINALYSSIEYNIISHHLYEADSIKARFMIGITTWFENWFPDYMDVKTGIDTVIRGICHSISESNDIEENELYHDIADELDELVSNWQYYLDIEAFIIELSEAMYNKYSKKENLDFNNVIFYTLRSNSKDGVNLYKEKNLRLAISKLLKKYFYEDKIVIFTRENGARQYMLSKTKDEILEEISDYLELYADESALLDIDEIISQYVDKLTDNLLHSDDTVSTR